MVSSIIYHDAHFVADENPYEKRQHAAQHHFSVQVWTGIGELLVGSYLLSAPLTCADYLTFFQKLLSSLLDTVPQRVRHYMWLQHDEENVFVNISVRCLVIDGFSMMDRFHLI
ncbi:hypothetical protein TNIN_498551 [Trichonephila inaurata madagascariensis]|uniref:Uncharacterized protein n=1 Tax=Trichonephila inaurata madagascariensis TaxID=2747483 RepID=A0A8X6X1F8_9ARAC|nr:hypothetical protein TNIN_498551 [Trichonephila inaurata madagascariensis]